MTSLVVPWPLLIANQWGNSLPHACLLSPRSHLYSTCYHGHPKSPSLPACPCPSFLIANPVLPSCPRLPTTSRLTTCLQLLKCRPSLITTIERPLYQLGRLYSQLCPLQSFNLFFPWFSMVIIVTRRSRRRSNSRMTYTTIFLSTANSFPSAAPSIDRPTEFTPACGAWLPRPPSSSD